MWLIESVACIHLKPYPMDYLLPGWGPGIYIQSGASAVFIQLHLKTHTHKYMPGWGQSVSLGVLGARVYISAPSVWQGDMDLIPISVNGTNCMNPPHINVYSLMFWYLNAQNYISRERLASLKCSQFPLTIMEQRHTHIHHCSEKWAKYGRWLGFRSVTGDSQKLQGRSKMILFSKFI